MMIRLAFLFLLAASPAFAQSPRQALMAELAAAAKAENPAFAGFSSERGKALYMTPNSGGKPETPSCSACHSDKPNAEGRNVRTGKPIPPMAVSVNAKRFTDREETEKWFGRNCKEVLGRNCTATEKGDFATWLTEQ
jgi:cytochrome c553